MTDNVVPLFFDDRVLCQSHDLYEKAWIISDQPDPDTFRWTLSYECGIDLYLIMTRGEYLSSGARYLDERWSTDRGVSFEMAERIIATWETRAAERE